VLVLPADHLPIATGQTYILLYQDRALNSGSSSLFAVGPPTKGEAGEHRRSARHSPTSMGTGPVRDQHALGGGGAVTTTVPDCRELSLKALALISDTHQSLTASCWSLLGRDHSLPVKISGGIVVATNQDTSVVEQTLAGKFGALLTERAQSWEPERLAKNAADRRDVVERFDPAAIVQPGDRLDPFLLLDEAGDEISLDSLVADGPAVLLFFRFGECPACNIALPHYDAELRPALDRAGVRLVAVSPQLPERLAAFRARRGLALDVASDPDNTLARRLGISFVPSAIPVGPPPRGWVGELTGTGTWELPQPAVLVIEPDHTIRALLVSPDWLDRPEVGEILDLLSPAVRQRAA
jgi:peroxiredoxin